MNEEKKLNDEAVEDVAGGKNWDQYVADFEAFKHLNCTDCGLAKRGYCKYPGEDGQSIAFAYFGLKPDAVCRYKCP